jgi:hypothetical protein
MTAWVSFRDPAAPKVLPSSAIICPSMPRLASMSTSPMRIAHARLGAASSVKTERTVM